MVTPSQVLQLPVRQISSQVSGAIQPLAWRLRIRMWHELLGRLFRPTQIPTRQTLASQENFPGHSNRYRFEVLVQYVHFRVCYPSPYRRHDAGIISGLNDSCRGYDCVFGWTIVIDEFEIQRGWGIDAKSVAAGQHKFQCCGVGPWRR